MFYFRYVQRKKFTVDLDVMRFNSVVDTKSQFSTSPLNPKEHKKILEGLPYSGTGMPYNICRNGAWIKYLCNVYLFKVKK